MAAQVGMCLGWSETPEDTFSHGVAHMPLVQNVLFLNFENKIKKSDNAVL